MISVSCVSINASKLLSVVSTFFLRILSNSPTIGAFTIGRQKPENLSKKVKFFGNLHQTMNRPPKRLFEFGRFRIDAGDKVLSRDGVPLPVTPKAFEILLTLVENHGRTVGKDELIDRVWADTFVEVGNLNRNVSTLRSLLGDDSHHPIFIRTLPKRGYRFDADVREVIEDEEELIVERRTNYRIALKETASSAETTAPGFHRRRLAIWFGTAMIAAGLLSAMVFTGYLAGGTADSATSSDARAAELYREGRTLWQDRTGESLHRATMLLEQAVEAAPDMAVAHAALADAYVFDIRNRAKAEETANRALALDPSLGEPHATIGFLKMFWDWNFAEAETHFKKAVTLSPNYATGHHWYAINMAATGRGSAALAEMRTALELAPDSLPINADMCQVLYYAQRFDDAEKQCRKTLELDPMFFNANLYLYDIYSAKGLHDEAVAQFFRIEELVPSYSAFPRDVAELKNSYKTGGIRAFWQDRIEMLKKLPSMDYQIAIYHARLGENEKALASLKAAHEKHDLNFLYFLAEPLFLNCCYSDPRYDDLQMRVVGKKGRGY